MKKLIWLILLILFLGGAFFFWKGRSASPPSSPDTETQRATPTVSQEKIGTEPTPILSPSGAENDFVPPLNRSAERITKKEFGTFVTPQNSPVEPERFRGYHVGVDFETFPEELRTDVTVYAVCDGKLLLKKYASGYGGVAVESCTAEGKPMTVIYGHVKLASIEKKAGEALKKGEAFALLGANKSAETDGERKHLHLGFHPGSGMDIKGYVQSKSELSGWLDPCQYSVCGK